MADRRGPVDAEVLWVRCRILNIFVDVSVTLDAVCLLIPRLETRAKAAANRRPSPPRAIGTRGRYWKCALCGHMSRFTHELSRYRTKNPFQALPELAQEVGLAGGVAGEASKACLLLRPVSLRVFVLPRL